MVVCKDAEVWAYPGPTGAGAQKVEESRDERKWCEGKPRVPTSVRSVTVYL